MSESRETSGSTPATGVTAAKPELYGGGAAESSTADAQEVSSGEDDDDLSVRARARRQLGLLRPHLVAGAVFRLPDSVTGRTTKSGRRPVVIIGPVPTLDGAPEIVLQKQVRVCTRRSLKPRDVRPSDEGEILRLAEGRHLLFTPKGSLPGFNKDGFFEIDVRLPVPICALDLVYFEGWLPRPFVDFILLKTVGKIATNPYPPSVR